MAEPRDAKRIFEAALERPRSERAAFVEESARDDPRLRAKLLDLLRAHDEAAAFLVSALDDALPAGPVSATDAESLDRYRLIERIGEGGMGEVWLAEQREPVRREVAVKIIKLGMDTREVVARFEAERQALALMDHPHIAKVFDAGVTDSGRPYFVMELARGVPITRYCDEERLSIDARVRLFRKTCDAIQHAHHKGVIHRDVKPSNVLVVLQDGVAVPKVIDFGIAKATGRRLTEQTLQTHHRQLLGTPQSMSPEQTELGGVDVDARTDIYSLGVLLYELLTGTHAFRGGDSPSDSSVEEILQAVREVDPERPSVRANSRALRGDLDWIVLRAMEKDRERRYATAVALADDLGRYLEGEPVEASPPSARYRFAKYVRRHRVAVVAGGLVVVSLLVALAASIYGYVTVRRESELAQRERDNAADTLEVIRVMIDSADPAVARGDELTLREAVDQWARSLDQGEFEGRGAVEAAVRNMLGLLYMQFDRWDRAAEHLERAVSLRRAAKGDLHRETLESLNNLGVALEEVGDLEGADRALNEALEGRRETLGPDHLSTLTTMINIGTLQERQERLEEAEANLRAALSGLKEHHSPRHFRTLQTGFFLGSLLMNRGEYIEAESLLRDAVRGQESVLGGDHPHTLNSMWGLSSLLLRTDRSSEAVGRLETALERCRVVLGDEHDQTLRVLDSLGVAQSNLGQLQDAERVIREVFVTRTRVLGESHRSTIHSQTNLAVSLARLHRFDEAEPLFRAALDITSRAAEGARGDRLFLVKELGSLLFRTGRAEEAELLLREAVAGYERLHGALHPRTQLANKVLARLLAGSGRHDEAVALIERSIALGREEYSADDPRLLSVAHDLGAVLLRDLDRPEAAEPLLRQALEGRRALYGASNEATLGSMSQLAWLCQVSGRSDEAEALSRELVSQRRETLGAGARRTLIAIHNLGWLLYEMERLDEAEESLREAARAFIEFEGGSDSLVPNVLRNYVRVARALASRQSAALGESHDATAVTVRRAARMQLELGFVYARRGRAPDAVEALRGALSELGASGEPDDARLAEARALLASLEESAEK